MHWPNERSGPVFYLISFKKIRTSYGLSKNFKIAPVTGVYFLVDDIAFQVVDCYPVFVFKNVVADFELLPVLFY